MEIKRTLDTVSAKYDLIGLDKKQFGQLFHAYEKQWYIYCNRYPEKGDDPLLDKMRQMIESDTLII